MPALVRPQAPTCGPVMRQIAKFVTTPLGTWYFTTVAPRIDRVVMPLTKGRVRSTLKFASVILINTGAKSGAVRRTPLLYFTDGDNVVLVASNGGAPHHPAWYHNVLAHPDVEISDGNVTAHYRGHEAEGDERLRLWAAGNRLYPGYEIYQTRAAERRIPVLVFVPVKHS